MKKRDLIREVSQDAGIPMTEVRRVLESVADRARDALARGEEVYLFSLGKLATARRGVKKARNIHTGEQVLVPERNVVLFKPSVSVIAAANAE